MVLGGRQGGRTAGVFDVDQNLIRPRRRHRDFAVLYRAVVLIKHLRHLGFGNVRHCGSMLVISDICGFSVYLLLLRRRRIEIENPISTGESHGFCSLQNMRGRGARIGRHGCGRGARRRHFSEVLSGVER